MNEINPMIKMTRGGNQFSPVELTRAVKEKAISLGAHLVGIAPMKRMEKRSAGSPPQAAASRNPKLNLHSLQDQPWGPAASS